MINGKIRDRQGAGREGDPHDCGKRRGGPFIAVNMAAIPRELVESELFGHEKGAFTGANARKVGRFEQAEGGTLFLDEIGDMPLEAQTRLLRVLQSGEFMPVGGRMPIKADLRIVAATHRDLRPLVAQGLFREDLFYRLNVVPIRLPPLRKRVDDIPALVQHFLNSARGGAAAEDRGADRDGPPKAYDWPGNVRELENLVRRLTVLYAQDTIGPEVIEAELREGAPVRHALVDADQADGFTDMVARYVEQIFAERDRRLPPAGLYGRILREVERPLIARVLSETRGNQLRAAPLCSASTATRCARKIRELDIEVMRGPR